jgi:SRSO17 transposase
LAAFHGQIAPLFGRREMQRHSEQYLRGLLLGHGDRRNAETIAAASGGVPARALQRLLSSSPWPVAPVIDVLQRELANLLNAPDGHFVLGEIGFPKQGNASVGVARQVCGLSRSAINQQVGVFLAYASSRGRALVDAQLYLPPEWATDFERRRRVGVPDAIVSRSCGELGLTMLQQARARGCLTSNWVAADMPAERGWAWRDALDASGWSFVTEVPRGTPVFSAAKVPSAASAPRAVRQVQDLETALAGRGWHEVAIETTPGRPVPYHFAVRRVFESRDGDQGHEVWMLVRRDLAGGGPRYYLSNAPSRSTLSQLAQVAADCSSLPAIAAYYDKVGLHDYEVRSWSGWHHHIALVLLAGAVLLGTTSRPQQSDVV